MCSPTNPANGSAIKFGTGGTNDQDAIVVSHVGDVVTLSTLGGDGKMVEIAGVHHSSCVQAGKWGCPQEPCNGGQAWRVLSDARFKVPA